jgi:hypothetical protein
MIATRLERFNSFLFTARALHKDITEVYRPKSNNISIFLLVRSTAYRAYMIDFLSFTSYTRLIEHVLHTIDYWRVFSATTVALHPSGPSSIRTTTLRKCDQSVLSMNEHGGYN